ncbi:Type VI secretion system (T6SS), amidase effector protein 4 [Pseudomonas asturiensis]|uniref:Type VI secretion system (T6SS), amidase effector protein 4 n=1 Tax=Pseudomonas asturiensis TaxID=1190415 RepID=A0A1M7MD55_9PSED|nr:type VI secretion system amidase effector protein Tae4 [Pseudomonas asturiensis]SHM88731.1 Type VI secretion system (T6SS), amidase effector protein 4 [Pseudomonas asturiensis]
MIRPSFSSAWAASQRIYDAQNPSGKVATVIGGTVAMNVNSRDPNVRWVNTCAVRMSYILNYSGSLIPRIAGETVSGADKRWYFFRVKNLIAYLERQWGEAETVKYPAADGGPLAGKKGLILFEVSGWSDAQGHATLFDGSNCYDHCYFNEPGVNYQTDRANFWSLR